VDFPKDPPWKRKNTECTTCNGSTNKRRNVRVVFRAELEDEVCNVRGATRAPHCIGRCSSPPSTARVVPMHEGRGGSSDSWYHCPSKCVCRWGQARPSTKTMKAQRVTLGHASQRKIDEKLEALLHRFCPSTWNKDNHIYYEPPLPFTGHEPGCTHPYGRLPSLPGLFDKFWTPKL
jgi:hypothetical protein